jgi:hypothetical protein
VPVPDPEEEAMQRAREARALQRRYVRLRFAAEDMLVEFTADEAGYVASSPYLGGPIDATRYWLVRSRWGHDHCSVCAARIHVGDEWWVPLPPDQVGICLSCHARLFGTEQHNA